MDECGAGAPASGGWSCTVSTHMRSLGRVLGTFDKIGRDLFIEAAPDRLLFRTLNQAQSVFCLCTLPISLFDHFEVGLDPPNVKIWLKLLAPLFRSQSVRSTTLELMCDETSSFVRVTMRCNNGLTKQFDLSYEEVVPVNAMYNLDECAHRLCAEPRLLLGCVNNLPHSEHELMLSVTHSELIVKNDVDDSLAESEVRTEMSIAPSDLNEWSIGALATNPLRISFATKEFKAMLHFADTMPISVHFDFGGRPLILVAHTSDGLERARLECVIATNVDQAAAADDLFGDGNDEFAHNALDPQQLGVNASQLVSGAQGGLEPNVERADGTFPQTGGFGAASAQPFELGGAGAGGGREPSLAHGNGVTAAGGGYSQPPAGGMPSGDTVDTNTSLPLHAPHRPAQGQGQQPQGTGTDHISSFPSARQPTHQQHHPPSQQPSAGAAALTASHAHGAHEALRAAMEVDGSPPEAHAHAHMHGGSAGGGAATPNEGAPTPLRNNTAPDGSDTDNDDDAVGATPPDSPPSKRVCAGFVEQFALPTGPSCNR